MRIPILLRLCPLLLLGACQLVASTDAARGAAHIGAATVHVEPANPNTLDDLHVVLDAAPSVPEGLAVAYTYAWQVDGTTSAVTTDTVPASMTQGGQTWSVTVTPTVNGVAGVPSTASVVVAVSTLGTPVAHVEPANPTTADTLRVVIDTPVVDADGRAVTYAYAWSVDGTPSVTTATVGPELTTRGQHWTVAVAARAGDAVGESTDASATIGNAPPTVDSLGFDRYRPMLSDGLTARTIAHDSDGDPVTVRFAWTRNTSIRLTSETSEHLDFVASGFQANDSVEVVATANDGFVDGPSVMLGPIQVYADAVGWRRVLPNRIASVRTQFAPTTSLATFYDPDDHRHVLLGQDGLWERTDEDGRWTQLFPSASIGVQLDTSVIAHPEGNEVFVLQGGQVLRLSLVRGREAWTVLGTCRASAFPRTGFYDDVHHRLVVADDSGIGAFDVDSHQWKDLDSTVAVGGAFLHEPGGHVAYLVGGAASNNALHDTVYTLDLDTDVLTPLSDVHLPAARAYAAVAVDPATRRGYVLGGTSAGLTFGTVQWDGGDYDQFVAGEPADDVYVFDFAHPSFATLVSPAISPARTLGAAAWDVRNGRILYEGGMFASGAWSSDRVAIDPTTGSRTAVDVVGHDTPRPGCVPTSSASGGSMFVLGGTDAAGDPTLDRAFRFAGTGFDTVPLAPDPTHGYPPSIEDGVRSGSGFYVYALAPNADGTTFDTWMADLTNTFGWRRDAVGGLPVAGTGRTLAPISNPYSAIVLGTSVGYRMQNTGGNVYAWSSVLTSGAVRPSTQATPFYTYLDGAFTLLAVDGLVVYTAPWNAAAGSQWTKPTVVVGTGVSDPSTMAIGVGGASPRLAVAVGGGPNNIMAETLTYSAGYAWARVTPVTSGAFETPPARECHVVSVGSRSAFVYGGTRYPAGYYGSGSDEASNDVWELVLGP